MPLPDRVATQDSTQQASSTNLHLSRSLCIKFLTAMQICCLFGGKCKLAGRVRNFFKWNGHDTCAWEAAIWALPSNVTIGQVGSPDKNSSQIEGEPWRAKFSKKSWQQSASPSKGVDAYLNRTFACRGIGSQCPAFRQEATKSVTALKTKLCARWDPTQGTS